MPTAALYPSLAGDVGKTVHPRRLGGKSNAMSVDLSFSLPNFEAGGLRPDASSGAVHHPVSQG